MKISTIKKGDEFYEDRNPFKFVAVEDARLVDVYDDGRDVEDRVEGFGEQWAVDAHVVGDPSIVTNFMQTTGLEHYGCRLSSTKNYI